MKARKQTGIEKCLSISRWMKSRHEKIEAQQKQLALHYAQKAWPDGGKPDTSWFHLFHNWTLGVPEWHNNVFAHKALDAWYRVGSGHYEKRKRVWCMAYDKYVK
jgi:hypothetical protein